MSWPTYGNAYAGATAPSGNALSMFAHRTGSWKEVTQLAHRGGTWKPTELYQLPANLDTDPPPEEPTTTVINITDLLLPGETLTNPVNNTQHMLNALGKVIRRTGIAAITAVTTDHVTIDFEDTYWRCEDPIMLPLGGHITQYGITHPCFNWPGGITFQNGGIDSVLDDGDATAVGIPPPTTTTVAVASNGVALPTATVNVASTTGFLSTDGQFRVGNKETGALVSYTGKTSTSFTGCTGGSGTLTTGAIITRWKFPMNRNRFHLGFQQTVERPNAVDQRVTLRNFWVKGPHTYAKSNYIVEREAQHAINLVGLQHMLIEDCKFEQTWGDAVYMIPYDPPGTNTKFVNIYNGMIEILGGTFTRIGRIFVCQNNVRAPDGVIKDQYWMNPGDGTGPGEGGINNLPAANDAPSISGTQYGLLWHGNAAHPFLGTDCSRSIVDIEPIGSYQHICDVRIGADVESTVAVDQLNFKLTGDGNNFCSAGNGWGLVHRYKVSRLWRHATDWRACSFRFVGSPVGSGTSTTVTAGSNGQVLTGSFTLNVVTTKDWNGSGFFTVTISGTERIIQYQGKTTTTLTGCTALRGGTTGTFLTNMVVKEKWSQPERAKRVHSQVEVSDCLFTGDIGLELEFQRVDGVTIVRNTARYRAEDPAPLSEVIDCLNYNKGDATKQFGSNTFTL